MEPASSAVRAVRPIDPGLLTAAANRAVDELERSLDSTDAIEAGVEALYQAVAGVMPSVFVLEHGRLWLVAQRGYAVVPDGIPVESGITGRAVRLQRPQLALDVNADPDYVSALPGIASEVVLPLMVDQAVVGVLNVEAERALPEGAAEALRPLAHALAPRVDAIRTRRTLDLPGLARLFVRLGSLRDPEQIAALAAASLARILPVESSQILAWEDGGPVRQLANWQADGSSHSPLTAEEAEQARAQADASVVCHVLDASERERGLVRNVVWLPLRANAGELGALAGITVQPAHVDPALLDTAAVLAAHVGASLDASFALRREQHSAATDPLTGILNRRGLEAALESALASARDARRPLSLLVIDCDDFKEINDRSGHEFGDAMLREVADVLGRVLPSDARAARVGGDEFVVMLPEAGADAAVKAATQIRDSLASELNEAGFPLNVSIGVSTYPFDGAKPTALLRAGDQALYAAKLAGKNRVASFGELRGSALPTAPAPPRENQRRGRNDSAGLILLDALEAVQALEAEDTADGVCARLCKALVFVVGATACQVSRVLGDLVVDAHEHALREVHLGDGTAYRLADFPLTERVLRERAPRTLSFLDKSMDPAEAFILRDLDMNALLMLPLYVRGEAWGLIELYEMRLRRFTDGDIGVARFLTAQAERRLDVVAREDDVPRHRRVYELPGESSRSRSPRTR